MNVNDEAAWALRDAVLLWLYKEKMAGSSHPRGGVTALQASVEWIGDPITERDFADATTYLKAEG
ncbi:hypothetical protein ACRS40_35435, partial [Nocardia asiatica]